MEYYIAIQGFENYKISNLGSVINDLTNKILNGGIDNLGYRYVNLYKDKKTYNRRVHKLVALHFLDNNKPFVDHINNNKLDNKKSNLRYVTPSENNMNRQMAENNTSGFKGVYWKVKTKKWFARICVNRTIIHLGYFDNIEDAKQARINKANELFGIYINSCEK